MTGRVFLASPPIDGSNATHHASPRRGSFSSPGLIGDITDQPFAPLSRFALALFVRRHLFHLFHHPAAQRLRPQRRKRPRQAEDFHHEQLHVLIFGHERFECPEVSRALLKIARPFALGLRKREVEIRCQRPWRRHHFRRLRKKYRSHSLEPSGSFRALPQDVLQRLDLQRRRAHTLSVDRVEAADRISEYEKTLGERRETFVMAAQAIWKSMRRDLGHSLRVLYEVIQLRRMQ